MPGKRCARPVCWRRSQRGPCETGQPLGASAWHTALSSITAHRLPEEVRRGYPFSPGHFVSSITYRDGLTALPWQG
jgi:hypothetical protein